MAKQRVHRSLNSFALRPAPSREGSGSLGTKISIPDARHVIWHADSACCSFSKEFNLILCSPPYYHPRKTSSLHGTSPGLTDMDEYSTWAATILKKASSALRRRGYVCFVKTDVRFRSGILPVAGRIAESCEKLGLSVRAHWIWQRLQHYSPFAPSFSSIYVLGEGDPALLRHAGIFQTDDCKQRKLPSSFTPIIFEQLIRQLSKPNDRVLDPFAGLCSTLLAAWRSSRWASAVEISSSQIDRAKSVLLTHGMTQGN
jgi:DNA modification methylase